MKDLRFLSAFLFIILSCSSASAYDQTINLGSTDGTVTLETGNILFKINCPSDTCHTLDGLRLDASQTVSVEAHGVICKQVTTSSGGGLFIPAKTSAEWSSFLASGTASMIIDCPASCPAGEHENPPGSGVCVSDCVNLCPGTPALVGNSHYESASCASSIEDTPACSSGVFYYVVCDEGWTGSNCDQPDCATTCSVGTDCCSGLCVAGACQDSCAPYGGQACSNGSSSYNSDGTCVTSGTCSKGIVSYDGTSYYEGCPAAAFSMTPYRCDGTATGGFTLQGACSFYIGASTYYCDTDEGVYQSSGAVGVWNDCAGVYDLGSTPFFTDACDSDLSDGTYNVNGICGRNSAGSSNGDVNCMSSVCIKDGSFYAISACSEGADCDSNTSDGAYANDGSICGGACIGNGSRTEGQACCQNADCSGGTTCMEIYNDNDGDGYGGALFKKACYAAVPAGKTTDHSDCCDSDAQTHPGQTAWFSVRNSCTSFDWNCSGIEEPYPVCDGDCSKDPHPPGEGDRVYSCNDISLSAHTCPLAACSGGQSGAFMWRGGWTHNITNCGRSNTRKQCYVKYWMTDTAAMPGTCSEGGWDNIGWTGECMSSEQYTPDVCEDRRYAEYTERRIIAYFPGVMETYACSQDNTFTGSRRSTPYRTGISQVKSEAVGTYFVKCH